MSRPWIDGPRELLQHAVDHLALEGDFDRRLAMISIDNAVEIMVKTHLGLPRRARGCSGPSRKELDQASESFPVLLELLNEYDVDKITGLSLDDIEWYHRIRNQLYHSGSGITVELDKVEAYLQIAIMLFENLFGTPPPLDNAGNLKTKTGEFLFLWSDFQSRLRPRIPKRETGGYVYYRKKEYLGGIDESLPEKYAMVSDFRNHLVHDPDTIVVEKIDANIAIVKELIDSL